MDAWAVGDPPGSGRACGTQTPLFVSNDDFVFSGAYPVPRFAQGAFSLHSCAVSRSKSCADIHSLARSLAWAGAFTKCLTLLYEERTGKKLEVTRYGKPHNVTYKYVRAMDAPITRDSSVADFGCASARYAENLLNKIAGRDSSNQLANIYGIGDNPLADIQGANNAGDNWSSILVRTGIYDGSSDPEHTPDVTTDCVYEAIKHIYEREGLDPSSL